MSKNGKYTYNIQTALSVPEVVELLRKAAHIGSLHLRDYNIQGIVSGTSFSFSRPIINRRNSIGESMTSRYELKGKIIGNPNQPTEVQLEVAFKNEFKSNAIGFIYGLGYPLLFVICLFTILFHPTAIWTYLMLPVYSLLPYFLVRIIKHIQLDTFHFEPGAEASKFAAIVKGSLPYPNN